MLDDALRRAGIHAGYPESRAKLARELEEAERTPTPAEIDYLARIHHKRNLAHPSAYLTKLLRSGRWAAVLEDLQYSENVLNSTPNGDPAGRWRKEGEAPSILDGKRMPCGCEWGKHKLGPRRCIKES